MEIGSVQAFMLGYADNTHLKGFQGNDVVQLGDYYVKADFGAVTNCDSPDFNGELTMQSDLTSRPIF